MASKVAEPAFWQVTNYRHTGSQPDSRSIKFLFPKPSTGAPCRRVRSDRLQRQFRLTEKVGLRFRAEFFNILNHPNFGNPNSDLTSPLFGRSTQTLASSLGSGGVNGGFNPLYQIGGPRSIQLALKLQF